MGERAFPRLTISEKAEKKAKGGHPWVFGDEILSLKAPDGTALSPEAPELAGALVDVYTTRERYVGSGFYNYHSRIRVRLLSANANDTFDTAFWERRLRHALFYRETVMGEELHSPTGALRLIFGEADRFPGFTVDRFGSILVAEVLSLGIDCRRHLLYGLLTQLLQEMGVTIDAIYERSEGRVRGLEGLEPRTGFVWLAPGQTEASVPKTVDIVENGIRYTVDYLTGQKTGFFLDQKYNRVAASRLAAGRRVLDCFTHIGSFGLNCAKAGAASVTSIDISAEAVEMANAGAAANGLSHVMHAETADVFELLRTLAAEKKNRGLYDYIILDPPAFTKSRDTVKNAYRGYKEINTLAMRLLPRGGYLATCSCSHFMPVDYFKRMLHEAAEDAGVALRQIEERTQAPDHPILWNVPETEYLKFYLFQVE